MFPKRSRLTRAAFRARWSHTVTTPYFLLKAGASRENESGIGVIVGTTVHKSAVRRNFWRRQTKATLLEVAPLGRKLLVILSPKVNTLTKKQFRKALRDATERFKDSKP